jgi:hypothetical protein
MPSSWMLRRVALIRTDVSEEVALRSSEKSVLAWATWRNIAEDGILHSHRPVNLKSYITFWSSWSSLWFLLHRFSSFLRLNGPMTKRRGTCAFPFAYRDLHFIGLGTTFWMRILEVGVTAFQCQPNYRMSLPRLWIRSLSLSTWIMPA